MAYSSVALLAFLVQLIINHDVFRTKFDVKRTSSKFVYKIFLLSVMLFYISDILWGILYDCGLTQLLFVDTALYFLFMALSAHLWIKYVIAYLRSKNLFSKIILWCGRVFVVLQTAVLVVNIFIPIMFSFDAQGAYSAEIARYFALVFQVALFFVISLHTFLVILKSSGLPEMIRRRYLTVCFYGLVMVAFTVFQCFLPLLPMYSAGFLIGTCLIHSFVIENEKEDHRKAIEEMQRRENEQMAELGDAKQKAYTDALTGAKNSTAFTEATEKINMAIIKGSCSGFAVAVFDINGMKKMNDTKGHDAGDALIKESCGLIGEYFAGSDVYRIGGDEFVAIIENGELGRCESVLGRFNAKVEDNLINGRAVVSAGLSRFEQSEDSGFSEVFKRADRLMYDRKRALKEKEAAVN